MGVDPIVFGFAAVDRFHVQGMAQDKGDPLIGAEIRDPVPGEHAFRRHDNVFPERLYHVEKGFPVGFYIAVKHNLSRRVQDAQIHFFRMQVDSTGIFVLFGVKCHWVCSFLYFVWLGLKSSSSILPYLPLSGFVWVTSGNSVRGIGVPLNLFCLIRIVVGAVGSVCGKRAVYQPRPHPEARASVFHGLGKTRPHLRAARSGGRLFQTLGARRQE